MPDGVSLAVTDARAGGVPVRPTDMEPQITRWPYAENEIPLPPARDTRRQCPGVLGGVKTHG